ncbi:EAL domain-containing protein [Butyrivibrio sp. FCS014]|uniref:EAL domain-containing protein n=1 Tax=Butyrivibrio sp. FCS014 TaxID=1408304 RepID=UPI0004B5955B|nr:EAL domain-containing protein [Butyrivibrio sp. FCS014]
MREGLITYYNYIGEAASLLISCLLMFAMLYTRPKKTYVYRFIFVGTIWSIAASILQIIIIIIANRPELLYNNWLFPVLLITYLMVYNGVLYYIFSYVNMMSLARRKQRREFLIMYAVLSAIYFGVLIIRMASGSLYKVNLAYIDIFGMVRFYSIAGIICAAVCFYATVTNKRNISRVIWHTVCIFVPIEIIVLLMQIWAARYYHAIFVGMTHASILLIAFLLFHNIPYDEESGCESQNALDEFIKQAIGKRDFYLVYTEFKIPSIENFISEDDVQEVGINACRSIEAISDKVRLFRMAEDKFVNVIDISDRKTALGIANQIRGVFDRVKTELKVPFNYVIITGKIDEELRDPLKVRQFYEYLTGKYDGKNNSYFYVAAPEDYEGFADIYEITKSLKDIRNRMDYNDERVLVYAQPIYSVDTKSFRVAEALMRLKIGDKIYSPDKFIPIAERSGCIHALSCIMLDKICRVVQELEQYYEFDAISVNISSKELSSLEMDTDFLDIIDKYDFDVSKIRMEITESAMFEDHSAAVDNMAILDRAGIQLYLDDFGTGYSSFERVMDCPVKTIKFDKTLLYKSLDDDRMDDILSYMIEVFKKNGFVTLVEGVEDADQNKYSVDRGFDYIQGYHYAKPEPIEELKKYFTRKSSF